MSFLNFLIALSPIIVVLVGILAFHQSAKSRAHRPDLDADPRLHLL